MSNEFNTGRWSRIFRPKPQIEVDDEFAFHLEERVREYVARGMSPEAAHAAALERFGDIQGIREECTQMLTDERRAEARREWISDMGQDVRFGIRLALRAPLFSLLAVLTLALGIGANAAVFGVVKSVLLDPLPYANADRLVRIYARPVEDPDDRQGLSPGAVMDLSERQRSFSRVAPFYHNIVDATYVGDAGPRLLASALVGPGLFPTLGVPATLGRVFVPEDALDGAPPVVILSHETWHREFAGDRGVLGRTMRIDGEPYEVVGVLPRGLVGPMGKADLWFPLDLTPSLRDPDRARGQHWLGLVGRLTPGVTVDAAQRELADISAELALEHPDSDQGRTVAVQALRDAMVGETRTPLLVLMASAALVLVITCANLAGALLSRTLSRRKELAVRVALGAGRGRLARQLLTESTLLSLIGGMVGLLLASLGLALLRGLALPVLPAYAEVSLDPGAVLVTTLLSLCTGIVFGVAPALAAGRSDVQGTLREESPGMSEGRRSRRLRGVLVAGQIALSLSLLSGAGLLARSLWAITSTPLGFDPNGVLTVGVKLPSSDYGTPEARARFFERMEERLRVLPGVSAVATTSELPSPDMNRNALVIEGRTLADDGQTFIAYSSVSHDYFRTLGIPVKRGRVFGPADRADTPPAIVISESMARRYWPNGGAVGARIRISPHTAEPWGVVVGIVGDVRSDPALPEPAPMVYASNRQDASRGSRTFVIRAQGDPLSLVAPFQRELAAIDPGLPIRDAAPLDALLSERLVGRRLSVLLIGVFSALALILASVGVYALFSSMASAREREFGVRMALGSSRTAIAASVLQQGAIWMVAGLAGGVLGMLFAVRLLRDLLYGVSAFDPVALGVAIATLLVCATVALLVPVRRAIRVDPITAMRG